MADLETSNSSSVKSEASKDISTPLQSSSVDLKNLNQSTNTNNTSDNFKKANIETNSPIKKIDNENSPSKRRNRRRNESKRRNTNNNNNKKSTSTDVEQNQQESSTPSQQIGLPEDSETIPSVTITRKETDDILPSQYNEHREKELHTASEIEVVEAKLDISKKDKEKLRDLKEKARLQDSRIENLNVQAKQHLSKIRDLETKLATVTRTCTQLDKLLQQELSSRTSLEAEIVSLNQTITRLKAQLSAYEKNKISNDELVRVLNATLMERETEVSILKLKLTRVQTNPSTTGTLDSSSFISLTKNDASQAYKSAGRSNSEFDRNSYVRSSMISESASVRASTSHLKGSDKDASVWATLPEELTPSKRPRMIEGNYDLTYGSQHYSTQTDILQSLSGNNTSTPLTRDQRRYKTLPRSMKNSNSRDEFYKEEKDKVDTNQAVVSNNNPPLCQVTNLDDSTSTSHSSGNKTNLSSDYNTTETIPKLTNSNTSSTASKLLKNDEPCSLPPIFYDQNVNKECERVDGHYSTLSKTKTNSNSALDKNVTSTSKISPPILPARTSTTPIKSSSGLKKIIDKLRRTDSSSNSYSRTELNESSKSIPNSPFKRGGNRSTHVGTPSDIRAQMTPIRQVMTFQTDKPFAEWDTDMLGDWMTMIGLSMYTGQCRRWVKCGAHIMNATPAEVDKGLGITNHLHRKKLRLAISELNGDCDKVTKAAARLDYLWVARWMDDIGLPQYKEAFINARVDGRVLNYLTVEDLVSLGVRSILHHASIRCGIRVLRSINFDLQMLKRRATTEEVEQMSCIRQKMNNQTPDDPDVLLKTNSANGPGKDNEVPLWTCHRVMEWLRMIDFAEFAPNLRGSGVHGGLLVFEDGFNVDTMCSILSIPISRTLLRRHLSSYFKSLMGSELIHRKRQFQDISSNKQLNPLAEIKLPKKSQLWFSKLKSSKVGQDGMDEYLCPMYPVEPQIIKNKSRKSDSNNRIETHQLSNIPESVNV